jgi:capsid protein
MPMIEPDKEGLAYQRLIRTGITTLSEVIRERGYDPETVWKEMAADNKRLDELGLVLDSDARNTTQAGNPRQIMSGASTGDPAAEEEPDPKDEKAAEDAPEEDPEKKDEEAEP